MESAGKIYICGTPIGNLGDMTCRLRDVLASVDYVFAEDTRVTSKLLSATGICAKTKRLDENTMDSQLKSVGELVLSGKTIAYCSDAGMPGVSDPGLKLVEYAHENNIKVEVIPGASAAVTAYVASGFSKAQFYFLGFLSKKSTARIEELKSVSDLDAAIIVYESPNRLISCLRAISEVYGDNRVAVCRELTKIHEEVLVGSAQELIKIFDSRDSIKGEIVIVIESNGADTQSASGGDMIELAQYLKDKGFKSSEISQALKIAYKIPKNQAYDLSLQVK